MLDTLQKSKAWIIKKSRAVADPAPNHNEQTDEFDLRYSILQGF